MPHVQGFLLYEALYHKYTSINFCLIRQLGEHALILSGVILIPAYSILVPIMHFAQPLSVGQLKGFFYLTKY